MKKKQNTLKERKVYTFRITSLQLTAIVCCVILVCFWMFALGVLTGRGVIFSKVKWLATDTRKTPTQVVSDNKQTTTSGESMSVEVLKPEKIEKQLEFFHNMDNSQMRRTKKKSPLSNTTTEKNSRNLSRTKYSHTGSKFFILVASFRKKEMAHGLVRKLLKFGYKGNVEKVDLKEKGIWFRVCVRNYSDREEAQRHAKLIGKKFRVSPLVMVSQE